MPTSPFSPKRSHDQYARKGRHRVCNGGLVPRVRYASGTVSRPPLGGLVGFIQTRPSDYETTGPPSTREAGQARQPGPHTGQRRPLRSATGRWARLTELSWTGGHVEARRRICHGRTDQEAKAAIALLDRFARKRIEKNSASDGGIARCRTTNVVDEHCPHGPQVRGGAHLASARPKSVCRHRLDGPAACPPPSDS